MSRVAKWKVEKAKVKVVFRLQFHATQIPQSGWEKLFLSFIPTETGKATAKTSKANVRNGTCKWADPIYESTRLLLDSKTKQFDDKLYKLVVGMGTSRSSILGEAIINLADYADASQPSAISLPLHGSDHGTILHVTVQLLTAKTGFREFEQQRDKGLQSGSNVNKEIETSTAKSSSSELQIPDDPVNKAKTNIQLKAESRELVEETNMHEEYSDSQVTCDNSSNTSENYYADKHEVSGSQSSPTEKLDGSDHAKLAIAYEENRRLRGSLEVAESSISELKLELNALQTHANEMGSETQKIAQELAIEIASGQELAKEVTVLKSECSKFKNDLQNLKEMKSISKYMDRKIEKTKVNGVLLVEDQIRELQKKIYVGFSESDLSFLNSDLEVLLSTVQDLKKGTVEPENILQFGEIPSLPLQDIDSKERKLLEIAKAERESLVKKMDQMEGYYEALIQELEENQKRILGEFQSLRNEHSTCVYTISTCKAETESIRSDMNNQISRFADEKRDLISINNELQKRATTSESALKRARLNYSIAVSQLQKDLDMLSFQVLNMFETNQTVIKEAFPDTSQPSSQKHLSTDLKKSLSLQENIYKKVEEELGEMCSANLCLDVYSGTLKETLFEANSHIIKTNEKLKELARSRDVLFTRLQTAAEEVHTLNAQNAFYLAKCNDLQLQNQLLETDLGNVSNENFLLMEKITECEQLLMDYRVYESKHEVFSVDNQNLQKELETLRSDIHELTQSKETIQKEKDMFRSEIDDIKRKFKKYDKPNALLEKLQFQLDSVGNKFKSRLESEERHVRNSEVLLTYLSSLELELQKMSSEDKNFVEQINGLDLMAEEFEKSKLMISELKQEKQDLMINVENKHEDFSKLFSEVDRLKECLRFVNDELDVEKGLKNKLEDTVACLTSELESQRSELAQHEEESIDRLNKERSVDDSVACQLAEMEEVMISEDLKLTFVKTQYETQIDEILKQLRVSSEQCRELEKNHLDQEARLNSLLENETRYIKENEILVNTVESLQTKFHDTEVRLNDCIASAARYVEENEKLSTSLESVRLELKASLAHNAEISESKNERALEVQELKDMLIKSEGEVGQFKELQMKLSDVEAQLNNCVENEARYIEENRNLATKLESLKVELEASIAHNVKILESNNVLETKLMEAINKHDLEVGQLKNMLTKSEAEVGQLKELEMKVLDTGVRLNDQIASEAHYIEENEKLSKTLESVKLDISRSNNEHALEVDQLKDMLTKSEAEVGQLKELETKLLDTESRLNHCLENETGYIKENGNLAMKLESLRLELEASNAHNVELNNKHALEVGQLKDMLTKSEAEIGQYKEFQLKLHDTESRLNQFLEKETRYIEENRNLAAELESVRLELNNILEQWRGKAEMLETKLTKVKNEHALEIAQLKDMLTKSELEVEQLKELETQLLDTKEKLDHHIKSETRYIEENESLRSKLDAIIAQNAALLSSNTKVISLENNKLIEVDDMLISHEESEIVFLLLKAKLDEQNDELIKLTNKLSEQILKTEEFKNMSIYLKELKESNEIAAREKKDQEGPSESLRMAFIKEQYQTKLQELKQQLSVSKKHNEEMLFKLQDALDEIETRKKSEASQLKKIEELSIKIVELETEVICDKPDYDRLKAELECAILSLECCKEEKEKLVALLQECEDEKSKISIELSLIKEQIAQKEENGYMGVNGSMDNKEVKIEIGEAHHLITSAIQAVSASADEESSLLNDSKQLMVINDQFRAQHLKSCMEQLNEELEKMKSDNSLLPLANYDSSFQDLQRELAQLHHANEELGSIYPNFVDFPGDGNALERVLALEIELAEALRTKKKSSIQFQSSFLKQHSDEEAVFKSFRDINELIKDMLEIKGKYVNVESELKEMHDRYSQLSLQFAEVEGERQKLMMTLKNVRSSRNLLRLNRSSMAALEDNHTL